ncbi:phosphotransferase [Rahnella aquatilis]|uniref:Thiamine kinase n=1 Tax=Rahnella aquatilis (strain ATCC 33071 / DSM 4594 / JCM 1683 / NBRC 105701 / NCIMB 13365 / CIP 78.65) TaxID=745277 RepID=H2IU67_RAHAC|nr:phosphotransferase [Rahnella aquatilis]AEX52791.1 putative choline kinase involved in LPS biosynthesis [Rahnella aquatilis CIP 78.65 = ATCC 33071]KFD05346.1 thiamine/adenosylcobinamide kinase [Rahnella aquatilis CIP 78.65 = ATCC 33071]
MQSRISAEILQAELQQLIEQHYPAVKTAGFRLLPVAGLTGESWRISSPAGEFLARHQSAQRQVSGADRQREAAILRHIARHKLGPCVRLYSPPWLIVDWIVGTPLDDQAFGAASVRKSLCQRLVQLHQLPLSGYRLDLQQQFARYWHHIDRRRLTPHWLRLHQKMLSQAPPSPLKLALVHMDIHAGNVLNTPEGLRLIDWEYAANADIALELAAIICGNGWDHHQQNAFIGEYVNAGGYHNLAVLQQQVNRWIPWVNYLMLMWFEVRWQQTGESQYSEWARPLRP